MASFRKRGQNWEYRIVFIDRQTGKQKESLKEDFERKRRHNSQQLKRNQRSIILVLL